MLKNFKISAAAFGKKITQLFTPSGPPRVFIPPTPRPQPRVLPAPRPAPRPPLIKPFLPPKKTPRPILQKYTNDQLRVSEFEIKNDSFEPAEKNGFTKYRPEIIAVTDFVSLYSNVSEKPLTSTGKLVELQLQALSLRRETLINVLKTLAQQNTEETREIFESILGSFNEKMGEIENTVNFYRGYVDLLETLKSLLNLKGTPDSFYDLKTFMSLREFFYRKMQYSYDKFEVFTNTKVFLQLLFDCRSIAENYSLSLLNLTDEDRVDDFSPTKLDTSYTLRNNFTFDISRFSSNDKPFKAWLPSSINQFILSLPRNPDDRIRLLLTVLVKELMVSRGLKKNENFLKQRFDAASFGSPFPQIFGEVGENIFEIPRGEKSLAKLSQIRVTQNENDQRLVLPFEDSYIDVQTSGQTFVPGSAYLVDDILNLNDVSANEDITKVFNTQPYTEFTSQFLNKINDTSEAMKLLFDPTAGQNQLTPREVFDRLMLNFIGANRQISQWQPGNAIPAKWQQQALYAALFRMANKDRILKYFLFEFVVLSGIASRAVPFGDTEASQFFIRLADELGDIREIPNAANVVNTIRNVPDLKSGTKNLRPYLEAIAKRIFTRVSEITNIGAFFYSGYNSKDYGAYSLKLNAFANQIKAEDEVSKTFKEGNGDTVREISMGEKNFVNLLVRGSATGKEYGIALNLLNVTQEMMNILDEQGNWWFRGSGEGYTLPDGSGRTRFRYVSPSFTLLMLFEIMSSISEKYAFSDFVSRKSTNKNIIALKTNFSLSKNVQDIIFEFIPRPPSVMPSGMLDFSAGQAVKNNGMIKKITKASFGTVRTVRNNPTGWVPSQTNFFPNDTKINRPFLNKEGAVDFSKFSRQEIESLNRNALLPRRQGSSRPDGANGSVPLFLTSKNFLNNAPPLTGAIFQQRNYFLRSSINTNRVKLEEEMTTMENIFHILQTFSKRINLVNDSVIEAFNSQKIETFLASNNTLEDLQIIKNPDQIRNSTFYFDEIKKQIENSNNLTRTEEEDSLFGRMLITEEPQLSAQDVFENLMKQEKYLNHGQKGSTTRKKLISVGLPTGFSKELVKRVLLSNTNNTSFDRKQVDVITINVFKRDTRYSDLIFKPKKFIFDLSLYYSLFDSNTFSFEEVRKKGKRQITISPLDSFIQTVQLRDYEILSEPKILTFNDIKENEEYNFLTFEKKTELVKNHFQSAMLEMYINLTTGMKLKENYLLQKDYEFGSAFSQTFKEILDSYIENVLGKTVPEGSIGDVLSSKNSDIEVKDLYRLTSFGTSVFEPEALKRKVVSPKIFERIFHIPVDTDNFILDIEKTDSTQSGRQALIQNSLDDLLIEDSRGNVRFVEKETDEIILDDYFVTIETNF